MILFVPGKDDEKGTDQIFSVVINPSNSTPIQPLALMFAFPATSAEHLY